MTIVRWNPWQDMTDLHRELNQLFADSIPTTLTTAPRVPAAELWETEDALRLSVELPGLKADNIDVEVTAKTVSIKGDRPALEGTDFAGKRRSEFHYGKYERVIPLPVRVKNTDVDADYRDGILTLTLPKADDERNKVYRVQLNGTEAESN